MYPSGPDGTESDPDITEPDPKLIFSFFISLSEERLDSDGAPKMSMLEDLFVNASVRHEPPICLAYVLNDTFLAVFTGETAL